MSTPENVLESSSRPLLDGQNIKVISKLKLGLLDSICCGMFALHFTRAIQSICPVRSCIPVRTTMVHWLIKCFQF